MQITAEIKQTYDLSKFAIRRSNSSIFSLQQKATKRLRDRKENGKCTNATNWACGLVNPILHLFTSYLEFRVLGFGVIFRISVF